MESSKETGCRAPEDPVHCINDCDFFGIAATMNMCSKCQKDMILLKQEHTKLAAASSKDVVRRSSSSDESELALAGFSCKCGDIFCIVHHYSDKHNCPFDYRNAGQNAIAKANVIIIAEKLNKI
ncbi:zinc finger A20 and AN1 domain-containing stress-associated protein 8-like [Capsicum annuum]|uniref:zinc finger A20 and AN1 domain-containing stress-associated protein 8-like n=1 Tax=Capsicum annuum TaxID=4072 RepID=UPI001FB091FF|nr:zinc finger A20 and AN1 domain-containing stress-associated protein 8-like [Capsicum annuum]